MTSGASLLQAEGEEMLRADAYEADLTIARKRHALAVEKGDKAAIAAFARAIWRMIGDAPQHAWLRRKL